MEYPTLTCEEFDEASSQWRKNKISGSKGYFKYKCAAPACDQPIYLYTTQHPHFHLFADAADLANQSHPNQHMFCENHLDPGK